MSSNKRNKWTDDTTRAQRGAASVYLDEVQEAAQILELGNCDATDAQALHDLARMFAVIARDAANASLLATRHAFQVDVRKLRKGAQ